MGGSTGAPCAYPFTPQTTESLGFLSMFTLASVADPRLFDRVCDDKTWACNRHLPMVGLPTATGQAGKTEPGDFFHLRQGLLPGDSGMEGVSSRIIFEPSGSKKQEQRPFIFFWCLYCGNYLSINGTPALRSFIYVDVGEPTPHPCSMTGMMQDHHLL